jgi:hypothetical protein
MVQGDSAVALRGAQYQSGLVLTDRGIVMAGVSRPAPIKSGWAVTGMKGRCRRGLAWVWRAWT